MPSTSMPAASVVVALLPHDVAITTWSRADNSSGGKQSTWTWDKLVAHYRKAGERIRPKRDLGAPVFAATREECTPENCAKAFEKNTSLRKHRCDDAITSVTALVLDHDGGKDWTPVREWIKRNALAAILYESPSHMVATDDEPAQPRWRIVIPLSQPADPKRWKLDYGAFRLFLTAQTGVDFDAKCCNPSRIFYPPTRPDESAKPRTVEWIDGGAIDLPATLASLPKVEPMPYSTRATADASSIGGLDDEDRTAIERWAQGAFRSAVNSVATAGKGERNASLNSQAFSLLSRFASNGLLSSDAIADALTGAAKSAGLPDDEIRKTLESARVGAKSKPVLQHDLIAEWKRNRKVVPLRKQPRPQHDPNTGEVQEPGPTDEEPTFARMLDTVPEVKDARLVCPSGFRVVPGSRDECHLARTVVRKTKDGEESDEIKVSHVPLWVASELTSATADGNLLEICSVVDGRKLSHVLPRGLVQDPRKLAIALEGGGVALCPGKGIPYDVAAYVSSFLHANRFWIPRKRACSRMGWDHDRRAFLYGAESVGDDDMVLHTGVQTGADHQAAAFRPSGEPEAWRAAAEAFVSQSPAAGLALAAAAASPMLRAFGWPPVGMVLGGLGGTGKTSIVVLAGSAYGTTGDPSSRQAGGVVGNGIATLNALVGQFLPLADLPHIADEVRINAIDPRSRSDTEAALHALIDGHGRSRLRRDSRGTIATECSPGCAILGTETDPSEFLRKGGAMRRYLCPRPPYGEKLGQFRDALSRNCGHAGRALVHALVSAPPSRRAELAKLRTRHLAEIRSRLSPVQITNESVQTWADQIAVCLAAVEVAHELAPGLWPDAEVWTASILSAWRLILEDPGERGEQGDPVAAAYDRTVEWIAQHRAHLLPSPERMAFLGYQDGATARRLQAVREPVIGRVRRAEREDESDEEILEVDVYQSKVVEFLAASGYSMRTMGKAWEARGWLASGRNNRHNTKIAGVVVSVYRVRMPTAEEA